MIELDSKPVYKQNGYRVWYNGEKYWLFTMKDILAITNKTVVFSDWKEYQIYASSHSHTDKEPYKEFLANVDKQAAYDRSLPNLPNNIELKENA